MAVVWSAICALSALAAAALQSQSAGPGPQMRTYSLPGYGYIRYEVLPEDDESEPGEMIVVHEERRSAPPPALTPLEEPAEIAPPPPHGERPACSRLRAQLLARLFEVQGMQVEPEFAVWLERNLALGTRGANAILLGGDPLLLSALKADTIARGLAEDLARCEQQ